MNNYSARIDKIKSEHAELLKIVRESITRNKESFNDELDQVITVLDFEEENVKKYEAMVNAQELIISLTEEIVNATNAEEVFNIRKKINYYINKIKTELKKRDIKQEVIDQYMDQANYLRSDIAKYIRFLKRDNNINEIDRLYSNYDNLTIEELEKLKKLVRREVSYNTRVKKQIENSTPTKEVVEVEKETDTKTDNPLFDMEFTFKKEDPKPSTEFDLSFLPKREVKEDHIDFDLSFLPKRETEAKIADFEFDFDKSPKPVEKSNMKLNFDLDEVMNQGIEKPVMVKGFKSIAFEDVKDFFDTRAVELSRQYDIRKTHDYRRNSGLKNIVNLFKNIPIYIHNKRKINDMYYDYNVYYRGSDLASFMEYTARRNSIRNALKCLFSKSYLYSQEGTYLNNHMKCSEWLFNFCKDNSIGLPFVR